MNELQRFSDLVEQMAAIRDFMSDMSSRDYFFAQYHPDHHNDLLPVAKTTDELIYAHYEIDAAKLERERRALLENFINNQCGQEE